MYNNIKIPCPNCETNMKCGTDARILESNRDGVALCLACGFRAGLVLAYDTDPRTPSIRIPATVPVGKTAPAPAVFCPACRGPGTVRTSQRITPSLKILRVYCLDDRCGYRVNAYLELTEQLSIVPGGKRTGIPYRPGLIDECRRELEHTNKLPRLIHER